MAESSWPGPGPATVTEAQWETLAEGFWQSGLIGSPLDPAPVFADSTGMHVKIRAGTRARVRGQVWDAGDTDLVVPISANAAGSTRSDLVVLRLDRSTWLVKATVVEGTPGGGVPSIKRDTGPIGEWDFPIGRVNVPAGEATTITAEMVQPYTLYLAPVTVQDLGQPGMPSGVLPDYALRIAPNENRVIYHWPGGNVDLYRDTGQQQMAGAGGWSSAQTTYLRRYSNVVELRLGDLVRTGSSISAGTDVLLIATQIPPGFRVAGSGDINGVGMIGNTQPVRFTVYNPNASRANQIWITDHPGIPQGARVNGCTLMWTV